MAECSYHVLTIGMFHVVHDRIAIGVNWCDVGSKYVPPHVNITIGFGTFTSPTCVWPSLGWYTEWARLTFMVSRVDELQSDDWIVDPP